MIRDQSPVLRVATVEDLSDHALICALNTRHVGFMTDDPEIADNTEWGDVNAQSLYYRCPCRRWKYEVVDADTGLTLSRSTQYGGGELLHTGGRIDHAEAKREWLRRVQTRKAEAIARAAGQAVVGDLPAKRRRARRKP